MHKSFILISNASDFISSFFYILNNFKILIAVLYINNKTQRNLTQNDVVILIIKSSNH